MPSVEVCGIPLTATWPPPPLFADRRERVIHGVIVKRRTFSLEEIVTEIGRLIQKWSRFLTRCVRPFFYEETRTGTRPEGAQNGGNSGPL